MIKIIVVFYRGLLLTANYSDMKPLDVAQWLIILHIEYFMSRNLGFNLYLLANNFNYRDTLYMELL